MVHALPGFLIVSAIVILTPGPDTMLTLRNSLAGGRRGGWFTALGVVTGQLVWTLATSAGLAALLLASRPAFLAVKIVGAIYLAWLGVSSLIRAVRPDRRDPHARAAASSARLPQHANSIACVSSSAAFRQGLWSNLGNPKMAVFFPSLLPQFAPGSSSTFGNLLALGLVFILLTLTWLGFYAIVVARAGDFLRTERVRRILDGITGAALLGFGIRLASEKR